MVIRSTPAVVAAGLLAAGLALVLAWWAASAAQGHGTLAEAPMDVQPPTMPAALVVFDDSVHMGRPGPEFVTDSASNRTAAWPSNPLDAASGGFFTAPATLRTSGVAYHYGARPDLADGPGYRLVPPLDAFGFARSPDFNTGYFNPAIEYRPWIAHDGTPYAATAGNPQGNASATALRADPRQSGGPVYNLVAEAEHQSFVFAPSMELPAGTRYRMPPSPHHPDGNCGGLPASPDWTTRMAHLGAHRFTADVDPAVGGCVLQVSYWPATFYLREQVPGTAPVIDAPGYAGVVPVRIDHACGTGCHLWKYTLTAAHPVALTNFANWIAYYGTPNRAAIATLSIGFQDVHQLRLGLMRSSQHASYDSHLDPAKRLALRKLTEPDQRHALYDDLFAIGHAAAQPMLLHAVDAAGRQFKRTDAQAPVRMECQKNAIMLVTRGEAPLVANDDPPTAPAVPVGNIDGAMGVPFSDSFAHSLADLAASLYVDVAGGSPIRPDLAAAKVPVPAACNAASPPASLDCQRNLHVNFHGLTLGGWGGMFRPGSGVDPYTDAAVHRHWGAPLPAGATVDDIWHATVNTRGRHISSHRPDDAARALSRLFAQLATGTAGTSSVALSGARFGQRTLLVTPSYTVEGSDWSGRLTAHRLTADASGGIHEERLWEAAERMVQQSIHERRVTTWTTDTQGDTANISAPSPVLVGRNILEAICSNGQARCSEDALNDLLQAGAMAEEAALDYLVGARTHEQRNGGGLRSRQTPIGDIVHSTPVVDAPTDDYGYAALGTYGGVDYRATYLAYLASKRTRPAMVYVGANDGMLRAFHGGLNHLGEVDAVNGGRQVFAFIPRSVYGHLGNLLLPDYAHNYYVDGPLTLSDARVGGRWRTVLVGSPGAGGRGLFAIDVSNAPNILNHKNAGNDRLWELEPGLPGQDAILNVYLGNIMSRAVVAPFRDGSGAVSWQVFVGNGHNSTSNAAALLMLDLEQPRAKARVYSAVQRAAGFPNGLGAVVVLDRYDNRTGTPVPGRDGFADTVYGADRLGAIWRFDLLDVHSTSGTTLLSASRLIFNTQGELDSQSRMVRQPILGGLEATEGPNGGIILTFGTGSFSYLGDPADQSVQSIYSLLDLDGSQISLGQLSERTSSQGDTVRTIGGSFAYAGRGWYLDIPAGERVVGTPRLSGGVLYVPVYKPNAGGSCTASMGENWLYALDARTGAPALPAAAIGGPAAGGLGAGVGAVRLDGSGAPLLDFGMGILATAADPSAGPEAGRCFEVVGVNPADGTAIYRQYACGRQSWRQLR